MKFFLVVLLAFFSLTQPTHALTIIRDAEIEQSLQSWVRPLAQAADLNPNAVHIVLVQSPDINAFVAGGQNIFIYTGLIEASDNAGEILGVMAHELGHITGGHLVHTRDEMERASYETILGAIVGVGAAIATGKGQAAGAVIGGATSFSTNRFLSFSRAQESTADQAALRLLRTAKLDATGLVTFMQKLADRDILSSAQQAAYGRTHPLSRDRVDSLRAGLTDPQPTLPTTWNDQHARMKAKLLGFTAPERVAYAYAPQDKSVPAQYARTIAAYRRNKVEAARGQIDALITAEPQNPYFHELKGQMLFDFGQVGASVASYKTAHHLSNANPLITLAYARALMEVPHRSSGHLQTAATLLEQVRAAEPRSSDVYRYLGIVHGRLGDEPRAQFFLAEAAWRQGRLGEAAQLVGSAAARAKPGSTLQKESLQLRDYIDTLRRKQDD